MLNWKLGHKAPEKHLSMKEARRELLAYMRRQDEEKVRQAMGQMSSVLSKEPLTRIELLQQLNKLALRLGEYAEETGLAPVGITQETVMNALAQSQSFENGWEVLCEYVDILMQEAACNGNSGARQAAIAIEYIRHNYANPALSLQHLTQHLSVSTSYFSNMFKSYTGITFIDFLTRLRIEEAEKLLLTTDYKNYEIAARVGYDDPGYFGSIFKKTVGCSPSEYRKNSGMRQSNETE